eukprot:scaffold16435_cov102-Skeletonema_marinoi.AAC.1
MKEDFLREYYTDVTIDNIWMIGSDKPLSPIARVVPHPMVMSKSHKAPSLEFSWTWERRVCQQKRCHHDVSTPATASLTQRSSADSERTSSQTT